MSLALLELWERFGRLRAVPVVGGFFLALVPFAVLPGSLLLGVAAVVLLGGLTLHCVAREHGGWDVFCAAICPGCAGELFADVGGISDDWGLLLVPFSLAIARGVDRGRGRAAPAAAPR